uniref:Uncharacterized protein n=1 Tax=Anguilla anguilla TaxID=7936 RepID=A0A0E9TF83_ANGAN
MQSIYTAGYLLKQCRLSTLFKGTTARANLGLEPTTGVTIPSSLTATLHYTTTKRSRVDDSHKCSLDISCNLHSLLAIK